jgi:DNA-directed RNA polymerase alpha subunit
MPKPLPIPQEVFNGIEDVIDQSRLAGFNDGYAVGFREGFKATIAELKVIFDVVISDLSPSEPKNFVDINKVREDFGLADDSKPAPIKELMGWAIEEPAKPPKPRKKRLVSVKALGLSTKTQNALTRNGITKVKQLTEMSSAELRKLPRIGSGSVKEIVAALKKHGRSMRV